MGNLDWNFRRFLVFIAVLVFGQVAYLLATSQIMFSDFLVWFYPFRGYEAVAARGPFLENLGYQDVVICWLPFRIFFGEALSQGVFPWWNPMEGAGLPPGALHSNGSYFPLHLLTFTLFPPLLAWHLNLAALFFVNSIGAYALFVRWSGSARGATLASLSWSLGGWSACYFLGPALSWPLAFFPWVLWGLDQISEGKRRGVVVVSLGIAGSLLAGHLQMTLAAALIVGGYILFSRGDHKGRQFLSCLAGVLLSLPHTWPLAELTLLSDRPPLSLEQVLNSLMAPREYLNIFFQNLMGSPQSSFYLGKSMSSLIVNFREHGLYAGQLTVLAALLVALRPKERASRITLVLVAVCLLFAGVPPAYQALATIFPPILYVTPLRFLPFLHFGLCFLLAVGWRSWEETPLRKQEGWALGGFIAAMTAWAATFVLPATLGSADFTAWIVRLAGRDGVLMPPYFGAGFGEAITNRILNHLSLSSPTVWLPLATLTALILVATLVTRPDYRFGAVLLILSVDMGYYFYSMNVPIERELFYPRVSEVEALADGTSFAPGEGRMPGRILSRGRGIHPSIPLVYGISNFESYQSVFPSNYRQLFRRLNHPETLAPILAVTTEQSRLTPGLLDLFGVSKLYNHPFPPPESGSQLIIEERTTALRTFLTDSWRLSTDSSEIFDPAFEPREAVLLRTPPSFSPPPEPFFQQVEPAEYGYDYINFKLEVPKRSLLVVTDLSYPGWRATVNGEPAPILEAYGFARAVEVPAGSVELRMWFRPSGLQFIIGLTLAGALLVLGLLFLPRRELET